LAFGASVGYAAAAIGAVARQALFLLGLGDLSLGIHLIES